MFEKYWSVKGAFGVLSEGATVLAVTDLNWEFISAEIPWLQT